MKEKKFYVCDSYHTETIADEIRKAFPNSTVFTDSTIISLAYDPGLQVANLLSKNMSEKVQKEDEVTDKIDFFILSAKLIDDWSVIPDRLKAEYGNNDSKIIAVSVSSYFLGRVKNQVDFTEGKETFLDSESIKDFFAKVSF